MNLMETLGPYPPTPKLFEAGSLNMERTPGLVLRTARTSDFNVCLQVT